MPARTSRSGAAPGAARTNNDSKHGLGQLLLDWVKSPETVTDLLQVVKAVIAATAAWAIVALAMESQLAFLAPWTALLTVHATVYRSFSRGVQTTVASTVGVGISFVIGHFLGVSIWTFALALFVGLAAARISWIRDEGVSIATTAIFVFASDYESQESMLGDRLIEVGIGVAMGLIVNLLVIPPLRDQQAGRYVDSANQRMGDVLVNMGDEFSGSWDTDKSEAWLKEAESISRELDSAWQTVRFARESERGNPRRSVPLIKQPSQRPQDNGQQKVSYEEILYRIDEGISHLRHLTRTLREASYQQGSWDTRFREEWVAILREAGNAIADPDAEVASLLERVDRLSSALSEAEDLPNRAWPIYGSLLTSLRHIITIVDDVASARYAREASEKTEA